MTRVVCDNPDLSSHGLIGTVVGHEVQYGVPHVPIRAGVLYNVVWLDYPDEGSDEIDGGNLKVVSEATYQIEALERRLDGGEA
jgi:hypothetical protein